MIDSHCHIAGSEFAGDLEAVVARARAAGLESALTILAADDEVELRQAAEVQRLWPEVRFSIGVHPHAAGKFAAAPAAAGEAVDAAIEAQPATRAVGEIGLDYHYDFAPRDAQHAVFRAQIALARRRRLPIVIHTREAEDDTFRILDEERGGEVPVVFHCFTGGPATARRVLDAGYYLSLAGIVTFPRALELKEVAAPRSARPPPRGDRQPLPGARPAPRHPQRAGARGPRGGDRRGAPRRGAGTDPRGHDGHVPAHLQPVTPRPHTD